MGYGTDAQQCSPKDAMDQCKVLRPCGLAVPRVPYIAKAIPKKRPVGLLRFPLLLENIALIALS